jgi:O-antigen/teichoic acid export membrane protein
VQFGIALGCGALVLSALIGRQLLTIVYTPEYAQNTDVFIWLMAAAGLGYVARFLVCSMTAARYLRAQAPLYALTLAVLSLLSYRLIPSYGLLGAAWAFCGGMLVLLLGAITVNIHAIRHWPGPVEAYEPVPSLLIEDGN